MSENTNTDNKKETVQVPPNQCLSDNDKKEEHIKDGSTHSQVNKSHDRSSSSTNTSTVSVLNSYDFVVSCKLNDDLTAVKSVYNEVVKNLGLSDGDEPGRFTTEQITKSVSKILKSQLQEYSLKLYKKLPVYRLLNSKGPKHNPIFKISVIIDGSKQFTGIGNSKQQAQQDSANRLLKSININ